MRHRTNLLVRIPDKRLYQESERKVRKNCVNNFGYTLLCDELRESGLKFSPFVLVRQAVPPLQSAQMC